MTPADEAAAAMAYIQRHSVAGLAPAVNWYEATCTAHGCRSLAYLRKHTGLRYVDLVIKAGLTPRGGWARSEAARRDRPQRRIGVPDEVEDQVEQEAAHRGGWKDAHGRTWLDGGSAGWFSPTLPVCMPRREEIGRQDRPDGTVIVTYRYYYPLK